MRRSCAEGENTSLGAGRRLIGSEFVKVLQINSVYGVGSTGKITQALHTALLADGADSIVLYGRGPDADAPGVYRLCRNLYGRANSLLSRLTGLRYGGCNLATGKAFRILSKEQPDVVHLQCINGNFINIYRLISWLKEHQIPTVVTLHAEFMYTANCSHAFDCERWKSGCGRCPRQYAASKSLLFDRTHASFLRMQRAFSGFDTNLRIVSVSPWLMERAKSSPIFADNSHCVILNGIDTEIFRPCRAEDLKELHNVSYKRVIFHATAMFSDEKEDPKGGWYVLRLAEEMPDAVFIVAGKHRLHGSIPANVILLGEIRDQLLLARYYSLADLTVLTSKRETFSLICAESLCCGTPVAGFCAGAPEQISIPQYSRFVPNGDLDALRECIVQMLAIPYDGRQIAQAAHKLYAKETMIHKYKALYQEVLCGEQR